MNWPSPQPAPTMSTTQPQAQSTGQMYMAELSENMSQTKSFLLFI
jgi:hypothetical protein